MIMMKKLALAAVVLCATACSVDEITEPPLSGPSTLALALGLTANPDAILWDGVSTAFITIDAKGPNAQPVRGVSVRLDMLVNGSVVDFGRLSSKMATTGDDGRARVTYQAPPKPAESIGLGAVVTILVTPVGGDFHGEISRQLDIRLIPPGVVVPPNSPPQAAFTFTPDTVTAFTTVAFNASSSADEGVPCAANCVYDWNFGDGGRGTGVIVTHQYREVGNFVVQLTVTDAGGKSGTSTQSITVGAAQPPTAEFSFSPTDPKPGQTVFFNGSASRSTGGRSIVSYEWDFGTGETASGVTVSKTYGSAGTYSVTLNVTDDANQVGTISKSVPVTVPPPTGTTTAKVP
jgi:PKD repeat protein